MFKNRDQAICVSFNPNQRHITQLRPIDQKPRNDAKKDKTRKMKRVTSEQVLGDRITLKDYLRLTTIMKKSGEQEKIGEFASRRLEKNDVNPEKTAPSIRSADSQLKNTIKSIQLLKNEIQEDLTLCQQKMSQLQSKLNKNPRSYENKKQAYQELVFLCSLHRSIKDAIMPQVEKTNETLTFHIHDKIKQYQPDKFTHEFDIVEKEKRVRQTDKATFGKKDDEIRTSKRVQKLTSSERGHY